MSKRTACLALLFLVSVFFGAISAASWINSDYGRLAVEEVKMPSDGYHLKGLLYVPQEAHPDNPRPAIIVTHGVSNTKEAISGLTLELAGSFGYSMPDSAHVRKELLERNRLRRMQARIS